MSSSTVEKLQSLLKELPSDENERRDIYEAAVKLMYQVETPQDTQQRLYHGHLPLATAQTGMDLNLFKFLDENKDSAFSQKELADITGAEPALLSHGMIKQVDQDTYGASNITHNLALPGTAAGIKH
ncbi:hypothetical protein LTR37_012433 [Vermiconidia calcicola]|uniref:Uncharacterized protein n=1 Tax=Vermiconidia calcicola TaxID=1690605 RepID=A0ACC3MZB3_9PEZI|nr:hypothetical protein LTR37_012433 [Vermiconidia calcicola]